MGLNKGVPKRCGRVQTDRTRWPVYAKLVTCAKIRTKKEGRCVQLAHIYKEKGEAFCAQHTKLIE
jgi:hypothetical protein